MASGWFAPPGPHAMRPQQSQQPGGGRFHTAQQRMAPGGGGAVGMSGGVNSPHTHTYHQRSSPPMRGPYHSGPRAHAPPPPHGVVAHPGGPPHGPRGMHQGGSGRFQIQHPPQAMVAVGGPRPMHPSNSHSHNHGHAAPPAGLSHSHSHSMAARHHAPSPGMPRRMQIPPPNAMRPIPQQARPSQHGHGPPRGMHQHQHMMRMQPEHPQQPQMHQPRPSYGLHHGPPPLSTEQIQRQMSSGGESNSENWLQQQHLYQQQPPAAPGTPEQRPLNNHDTHSRSPSPPPIPPPPPGYQNGEQLPDGSSQGPSPSSQPENISGETSNVAGSEHNDRHHPHHQHGPPPPLAKTPSWNPGLGLGPLRESRLQNMPQKRMMVPMPQHPHRHHHHHHHHHPHAQRPIPQHPNTNAFVNENMERFRAMELKHGGGPPPPHHHHHHHHGMKPIHHPPPQHPPPQILHPSARTMLPSPGHPHTMLQQPMKQAQQPEAKKGPDITMDAASMLLALRTSASPSTVSAATLEEQASRDHSEVTRRTNSDDLEDDDVPALASSSSSLSAPPAKPMVQHHEVPKNFPTRLALPNDEAKLNSLHCFLRSELLEIFVVERSANKSPTHSPGSSVGRVGLRCVFCAMARKRHAMSATPELDSANAQHQPRPDEAPMAVFYPKSIAEIYRLVTSWQRCHLRKCRNLPPDIRSKWTLLRENDKSRGKTHYWITSAKEIGLVDCNSRAGGIRFASPRSNSAASGSIATALSGAADNDSVVSDYTQGQDREGFQNQNGNQAAQGYQPHNNLNFMEGPSQKHREAVSQDVTVTSTAPVESPLKRENVEGQASRPKTPVEVTKTPMEVNVVSGAAPVSSSSSKDTHDSAPHDSTPEVTAVSSSDSIPTPPPPPSNQPSAVANGANMSTVAV